VISLIIPTHNRPELLNRSLDYYTKFNNLEILVCDSSDIKNDNILKYDIEYIHSSKFTFAEKILIGVRRSKNDYVCLSADDDFLNLESLLTGRDFLISNLDFSTVHGNYLMFESYDKSLSIEKIYPTNDNLIIDDEDPFIRIKKSLNPYVQLLYALHRKPFLEKCIETASKTTEITNVELCCSLIGMYLGKHKTLDILWMARDKKAYTEYTTESNFKNTVILNYYNFLKTKQGSKFIKVFSEFYANESHIDQKNSEIKFKKVFNSFLIFEKSYNEFGYKSQSKNFLVYKILRNFYKILKKLNESIEILIIRKKNKEFFNGLINSLNNYKHLNIKIK
tara:strand:+ start:3052 stop:4059 length:1008 start_codon:yes stop_codon:yes gene_type:complete